MRKELDDLKKKVEREREAAKKKTSSMWNTGASASYTADNPLVAMDFVANSK